MHHGIILQGDDKTVPKGGSGQSFKGGTFPLIGNKILQSRFLGNKRGFFHIFNHIDPGADAFRFRFIVAFIDIDHNLVFFFHIDDHDIHIVQNQRKAADNKKTRHRNADSGKGHKAMLKNTADAFSQQITKIIVLHTDNTHPFRR